MLNIFYIDDEPDLCDLFAEVFKSESCNIKTYSDFGQAIYDAKVNLPDVIFIDYRLPGTTGDKVALEMPASIPKFLVTGDIEVETIYKFDGIFQKPVKRERVQKVLSGLMEKNRNF